jgi:mannose-6-phosphate isomerase
MLYPLTFHPLCKERVWGGRSLERLYHKALPADLVIGESWEITDRPEGVSEIAQGPLAGKTLRWVMEHHERDLLGEARPTPEGRFPLLIKILDAREKLSLQVHPPAALAASLGGEPKTEMWYVTEADPGAELFVGLKPGITRGQFEDALRSGRAAECVHRVPVQADDVMFLPSGRLHAIGAGLVIFEIQQNSDTTYRVFDWNRVDRDGKARELHIEKSLACIDFNDVEPALISSRMSRNPTVATRYLVENDLFIVNACRVKRGQSFHLRSASFQILAVIRGRLRVSHGEHVVFLEPGGFVLVPAALGRVSLQAESKVEFLHIQPGQ